MAARLDQLRLERRLPLRRLVNEALRHGLAVLEEPDRRGRPRPTTSVRLGGALLPDIDDVSATLSLAEADSRR